MDAHSCMNTSSIRQWFEQMPMKEKWHTFFVFVHFVYSSVTVDTVVKFQPIRRRFLDWRDQSKWTVSSVCPQLLLWPRSCQTRTHMNAQFVIMQYSLCVCTQIFPPTRNHRIRDDIAVASIWTSTTYLIMSNLISSKVHKPLSHTRKHAPSFQQLLLLFTFWQNSFRHFLSVWQPGLWSNQSRSSLLPLCFYLAKWIQSRSSTFRGEMTCLLYIHSTYSKTFIERINGDNSEQSTLVWGFGALYCTSPPPDKHTLCIGRELNPDQLPGKQLWLPLHHQSLIIIIIQARPCFWGLKTNLKINLIVSGSFNTCVWWCKSDVNLLSHVKCVWMGELIMGGASVWFISV